ncbi:MAG: hypothetical protein HOQ24_03345 [Mycobacteriaceae bacterium]|nr:hypothetical protein [Mycobacteriaceae bacterium]
MAALDYGLRRGGDKHGVRMTHHALISNLPDGALLLGVQARLDPLDVLHRMVRGIDIDDCQHYAVETVAAFERIRALRPLTRLFLLSFPVGTVGSGITSMARMWPGGGGTVDASVVSRADLESYEATASAVLSRIGGEFDPIPVPASLFQWLWSHYLSRGAGEDPVAPSESGPLEDVTAAVFGPAALDEGAQTDATSRLRRSFAPVVKIMQAETETVSYQTMLTVRAFPYGGMAFPGGSEFLSALECAGDVTVDWGMRVSRRSADEVRKHNETNLRRLGEQLEERDSEVSFAQNTLLDKARMLGDYNRHYEVNGGESEVLFTTVIAVGGATRGAVQDAVNTLKRRYQRYQIELTAPVGAQVDLWSMLIPGSAPRRAFDDYGHIVPSDMWAGFVPFTSSGIGDESGPVIGVNLLSGHFEPIHFGIMEAALHDLSASFAVTGELGSGKSYFLKLMAVLVHDMGGQFLAIDRSQVGEWEHFANAIDNAVVIDLGNPTVSLDPLRVFAPGVAGERAVDVLLPLLDVSPTSTAGAALAALSTVKGRAEHNIHSMLDLHRAAQSLSDAPAYAELAERLVTLVDRVAVLFDPQLPPLRLTAAATVVRTHNLALPTVEELVTPHLYNRLPLTKRIGTAMYELVGMTAREAFLTDNGRFGLLVGDEAHHFTQTHVGSAVTSDFSRDGRKHLAAIGLASHDPATDFHGAAHNLIPNRFVFRQRDEVLARNSLEWLGVDPDEAVHLVKMLREDTSPPIGPNREVPPERRGEMFMRDALNRIGRGKVLGPARFDRADAIGSTPISQSAGQRWP